MNSNSPEDRLIDELIREQAKGPDESFLKQIEAAVDAGPIRAVKAPMARNQVPIAIAAGLAIAAGIFIWSPFKSGKSSDPQLANPESAKVDAEVARQELDKAIRDQEDKVEERRKVLATIARTKGIIYKGQDSSYGESGVDAGAAEVARNDTREEAIKRGLDAQDHADAKRDFDADQQQLQALKLKQAELGLGSGQGSGGAGMRQEIASNTLANRAELTRERVLAAAPSPTAPIPASEVKFPDLVAANDGALSRDSSVVGGKGGSGAGKGTGMGAGVGQAPASRVLGGSSESAGFAYSKRDFGSVIPAESALRSGELYGTFIDQPWKSPDKDPLSTFSIDVDTASYSNVRRMIQEGREIPRDAVRIEECVNAFSYQYAQPKGDGPFAVGATLAVCPWAPANQLVRIAIKGREIETNKRPASNLVFLIDVSGSMRSPDKLPLLKQSMATLVEQLDERDRVAIVVYAGTEGVALPSTRLDPEGRATVLNALGKLEAGGSTNGGAGIKRAYEIAMKEKIEGGVNRVILATDGDFNVGVTGQTALVDLVKDRAKNGVYLTVAGFGTGNLNDAMMDAITRDGNGNYFYIDSEREGRKVFLQNLSGTLVTIAKDVKIQVEFNPAKVGGYRLIGYANRVLRNEDFSNDKVDAGDIGAGHTVTAFYEISPPVAGADSLKYQAAAAKPAATDEWLTVKLRHKHPDGDDSRLIEFPLTGAPLALDQTDPDYQFATAAALFGMKLRSMDEVRDIAWEKVIDLAKPGLAHDPTEDRAEFVGLVRKLSGGKIAGADEPDAVDGPNVRYMTHEDGSRTVFSRTPDKSTLHRHLFSPTGELIMTATYRMHPGGNLLGCQISDGRNTTLFTVRYAYSKSTGQLVEEWMFDARVKRIDPETGKEMPVQKVIHSYDAAGKRGAPVVADLFPGETFEQMFGIRSVALEANPFEEPVIQDNDLKAQPRPRIVPAPAEVAPPGPR